MLYGALGVDFDQAGLKKGGNVSYNFYFQKQ